MGVLYVSGGESFVIGRDKGCNPHLDGSYVSRRHLTVDPVTSDVADVCVLGTNGAVVGGRKVNKGFRGYIRAGDLIVIGDHRIAWTGSKPCAGRFMRGFARLRLPEPETFEIEGPPQRKIPEKPSLLLAAGPALTMAIPILLGAGRTVMILSSLFAALFAALNVTGRIRRNRSEEKRRKNTYLSYLKDCEDSLRQKLEAIRCEHLRAYPPVGVYLKEGGDPFLLWAAEEETGVLTARIGTGTVPCPVDVIIPKERFAGIDDSLRQLPAAVKKKFEKPEGMPILEEFKPGEMTGLVPAQEKDDMFLSSLILQLAVNNAPDRLRIVFKFRKDLLRRFMWVLWLPHCRKEGEDHEAKYTLTVTDDAAEACNEALSQNFVLLVGKSAKDIPSGIRIIYDPENLRQDIIYDTVPPALCFSYAGMLSRLWGSVKEEAGIPGTVPFGTLIDISVGCERTEDIEKLAKSICENHEKCDIIRSFSAPIGIGSGGKKIFLDLHEKAHGPHGLVAGTTGSGKSELLTTLILSFSARYPPDKLAFFLIDYKGGGMSGLFERLPHIVGSISNLSAGEADRAMTALRSENIRRQKIFADCGVNSINDYTKLYDAGVAKDVLPHILIIIDEFAELRKEEPAFMDALISISQVGRSLGMHLILATQKPSGVIDDKIRGNSRFRIALRLVDRADSMDMLRRPDAADIRGCGRAYLQVGSDEIFECFQSGYAMGRVIDDKDKPHVYTDLLLEEEVGPADPLRMNEEKGRDDPTWYELTMKALQTADEKRHTPRPACLWLAPIPPDIYDDEAFAVFDVPAGQRYEYAVYDPDRYGHILITGRSGSGKSELIRTFLARSRTDMCTYVIDHGGGLLKDEKEFGRCGGYTGDDHPDDIVRMTGFMSTLLTERRKYGLQNLENQYPIILVLDNMPEIIKAADPQAADDIRRILMLGRSARMYVIASSIGNIASKDGRLFDTQLFLGNEDPYVIASALGVPARDIPVISDHPGRGTGIYDGAVLEFQAIRLRMPYRPPPDIRAVKYPHVPDKPSLEDFLERALDEFPVQKNETIDRSDIPHLPAGYIAKSGKIFTLPIGSVNCILIGGKPYCGRHTLLFNISIIASVYGISCVRADTYEALLSICKHSTNFKIVITESISDILRGFCEVQRTVEEEDELISYLENPAPGIRPGKGGQVIVALIENDAKNRFAGSRVFDSMMKHPFGISFGGCLDENRNFDFSYLPFNRIQKSQTRGYATVLKYDENCYSGDILTPSTVNVDNLQSL